MKISNTLITLIKIFKFLKLNFKSKKLIFYFEKKKLKILLIFVNFVMQVVKNQSVIWEIARTVALFVLVLYF